ncbi:MAG: Xaa-Pro peptidase family protein [Anaerolineales bacterium]|jgi:Xaa-Pro aminopeptidase
MKKDLDRLMQDANLDALLVRGPAMHNPAMVYFTGLRKITKGYLLKKVDHEPILYVQNMEREEAAASGLKTLSSNEFDYSERMKAADGNLNIANAIMIAEMLKTHEVSGRVAVYGKMDSEITWGTYKALEDLMPSIEIVGENELDSVLSRVRETKDEQEVERIRAIGKTTVAVVADVAGFLTSHEARDGILIDRDGNPVTIGDLKKKIDLWLAMRGAENPEGVIFASGRDAGIPHSAGQDDQPIPIGKPIVFDIFPCESGGGYFYDFTRTWCLGYAPDEVEDLYRDVLDVYDSIYAQLQADTPCRDYQIKTCEMFEAKGHPSVLSDENVKQGYVHSLAHGLGLAVHEAPTFHQNETNASILKAGSVITVEPGLYYPEREMGVRIEDTVWMRPDGTPEVLVEFPKDLVLKIPGV